MSKELIVDSKLFAKACESIQSRGKVLDADIQHAALSAINHAEKHGDIGFVNRLYLAMPQGSRKAALTDWLISFGKVSANAGEGKKEMPFLFDREKHTNMVEAAANPWFTFKLDKAPDETFDIIVALRHIIKKAQGKNVDVLSLTKVENLVSELAQAELSADE
jgi:hypothetical protein